MSTRYINKTRHPIKIKMKTCRICLVNDVKMFNLSNTDVKDFIERIFNIYGYNQNLNSLHYACFECSALLDKTLNFIQRVLKAQQVLHDMLKKKKKICQPDLRKLDRHKLGLNSNLRKHLCTVDFYINEDASDNRSSNININKVDDCMFKSKSDTEIKEVEYTNIYPHTDLITTDEDKLHDNKCSLQIKTEVISEALVSTPFTVDAVAVDSDNGNTMTNNQLINHLHTFDILRDTVSRPENTTKINSCSQSYGTVKRGDTEKQSNSCLNNGKCDESSCIDINSIIIDLAVPNPEIKKNNLDESECYVEIKTEEFPDPLASTSAMATLISLASKYDAVTNTSKEKSTISPGHYSCEIKPLDNNIKCDLMHSIDVENWDGVLSNMKKNLLSSTGTNVDNDWQSDYKPIKQKKRRYINRESTHAKKKLNIKTKSITSRDLAQKNNIIVDTARRKNVKYIFSDGSDNVVEEANRKEKKNDDHYRPTSLGESEDSMYDTYNDNGRHLKKTHAREYPRKCDHCNFEVPVLKEHYIHYLRFHRDVEYPYAQKTSCVCQYCGHISTNIYSHKTHELSHGEKTVKCTVCPKKFTSRARMKAHLNTVHRAKILECDYCGKTTKTRGSLEIHIRIHTGEKPYKCHICGVGFAHVGNRTIHIRNNHQQSIEYQKNKKARKRKYQYTSSDTDKISDNKYITTKKKKNAIDKRKTKKNNK